MIIARTLARSLLKFRALPLTLAKFSTANIKSTLVTKIDEEIKYES